MGISRVQWIVSSTLPNVPHTGYFCVRVFLALNSDCFVKTIKWLVL